MIEQTCQTLTDVSFAELRKFLFSETLLVKFDIILLGLFTTFKLCASNKTHIAKRVCGCGEEIEDRRLKTLAPPALL